MAVFAVGFQTAIVCHSFRPVYGELLTRFLKQEMRLLIHMDAADEGLPSPGRPDDTSNKHYCQLRDNWSRIDWKQTRSRNPARRTWSFFWLRLKILP